MSALTQETLHAVEVKLSPEQSEAHGCQAEKIPCRKLPTRPTTVRSGKPDR